MAYSLMRGAQLALIASSVALAAAACHFPPIIGVPSDGSSDSTGDGGAGRGTGDDGDSSGAGGRDGSAGRSGGAGTSGGGGSTGMGGAIAGSGGVGGGSGGGPGNGTGGVIAGSGGVGGGTGGGPGNGTGGVIAGSGGVGSGSGGGPSATGGQPGSGGATGSGGRPGGGTGGATCDPARPPSSMPSSIFDATPAGGCGVACNVGRAQMSDGSWAGLDCKEGTDGAVKIDGHDVTGCLAADFNKVYDLDPVIIRVRSVADACGVPCQDEFCGTGRGIVVFYGTERGSYQFAGDIPITASLVDYSVTLNLQTRYVVVCRSGTGHGRDDIAVDSIHSGNACPR